MDTLGTTDGRARAPGRPERPHPGVLGALVVVTIVALLALAVHERGSGEATPVAADLGPATTSTAPPPSTTTTTTTTTTSTTLPRGRVGVFLEAPGSSPVMGSGAVTTYSVQVEEAARLDPAEVAGIIDRAVGDPRGWTADGHAFQRVPSAGTLTFLLATPATVDELCLPLDTAGIFSCREGNQLNLNLDRWTNGTDDWPLGIDDYRAHVINHELGHALGHGHVYCPGPGQLAPVMMQQTKGLEGCVANAWPHPENAPG